MANWTVVGAAAGPPGSNTTTLNVARTPGAIGNLLIVGGSVGNGTSSALAGATPISDTQSHVWNPFTGGPFHDATNGVSINGWWTLALNTNSTTITINSNVASAFMILMLSEFTGGVNPSPLDKTDFTRGNSTNPTSATFTPTYNDELIWAMAVDSITAVGNIGGSAATKGSDDTFQDWSEYRILTGGAGTGITAAFVGNTGAWNLCIGTFNPNVTTQPDVLLTPRVKMGFRNSRGLKGPGFQVFN